MESNASVLNDYEMVERKYGNKTFKHKIYSGTAYHIDTPDEVKF